MNVPFSLDYWELIGLWGAGVYCTTYGLVAYDVLTSKSSSYYLLQFLAATLVATSLTQHFNVAALTIQLFFMVVSVLGFTNHFHGGLWRPNQTSETSSSA